MRKFKTSYVLASLMIISILLSGCSEDVAADTELKVDETPEISEEKSTVGKIAELKMAENQKQASKLVTLKGQILFQQIEGGFYSFIAEGGKKYTPRGMPKEHLRHGLLIQLTGQPLPEMITTTQFGEVIRVEKVIVLDNSQALKAGQPNLKEQDL